MRQIINGFITIPILLSQGQQMIAKFTNQTKILLTGQHSTTETMPTHSGDNSSVPNNIKSDTKGVP
jgi:hypothetical protein